MCLSPVGTCSSDDQSALPVPARQPHSLEEHQVLDLLSDALYTAYQARV